ncbi:40S ribosomal protein S19 [Anaeramoeba flamelloides]|uniref:40S ribosomal protein S19 n=1 Tax=Anaeramoeba flamelloides TaxID=1746091 RepID=A0ABQ8YUH5_9EUKA|nr:40S ribosomal protein S19 [Anaeramoeba flamelloides]
MEYLTRIYMYGGVSVKDVESSKFIKAYAEHLKRGDKFKEPSWVDIVKTGFTKELSPYDRDWYYIRAASILRRLYIRPFTGVGGFKKIYSKKNKIRVKPSHYNKGSGKIPRSILHQFEKIGIVKKTKKGTRKVTSLGRKEMDAIALKIHKDTQPKKKEEIDEIDELNEIIDEKKEQEEEETKEEEKEKEQN